MRGVCPLLCVCALRCHLPQRQPQPHPSHHHQRQKQDLTEEDVAFKAKQKADAAAMKKAAEALKAKKK